jgi:ribosomal protein S13
LRRKRTTQINTNTTEVTQIQNYISADRIAVTDLEYDTYGNLKKLIGASNYKGQRMSIDYA